MKFSLGQAYFWFGKKGIAARAIRFYNWRFFKNTNLPTHVGQIVKVEKDFITIAEALNGGLTISKYEKWWLENSIREGNVEIGKVKAKLVKVLEYAKKYENVPYGWSNIVIHAISVFCKSILKLKLSDEEKSLHCSEYFTRGVYDQSKKKINFEKEFNVVFDSISPAHIYLSKFIEVIHG